MPQFRSMAVIGCWMAKTMIETVVYHGGRAIKATTTPEVKMEAMGWALTVC